MDAREFIKKLVDDGTQQVDIAKRCKIAQSTISKILYTETVLSLDTIRKIAAGYNKPLSFFLEDWGPDKLNIEEESPGFGISSEEQKLLDIFRDSKSAKLAIRELLEMTEDQRLDWILNMQDKIRKGD